MALKMSDKAQIEVPKEDADVEGAVEVTIPADDETVRPVEPQVQADPLSQQMTDLRNAEIARQQSWQQRYAVHQDQLAQERAVRDQAEFDNISTAINDRQTQKEMFKQQRREARARGDFDAEDAADEEIDCLNREIYDLEKGIQSFGEEQGPIEQPPQQQYYPQQQSQQPQRQWTANDIINAMPNLMPGERGWLEKAAAQKPELLTTQQGQRRLEVAYYDATEAGLQRDTPEYFQFFDERFGFSNGNLEQTTERPVQQQQPVRQRQPSRQAAAPVSRGSHNVSTGRHRESGSRVQLTPQQRDAARFSGVDEVTYAKNLLKLQELKRQGHYQD
jgi:hypothetical protein